MKKFLIAVVTLSALVLITGCSSYKDCGTSAKTGTLKIGWGKRSLVMEGPVPITGQFYLRVSQGVFAPVWASALVLEDTANKDSVIFVSCDVTGVNPKVYLMAKQILKKEVPDLPVKKLLVNATHTHAGPTTADVKIDYPNKVKIIPGYKVQKFIARQIADAVKEAWLSRKSGSIAYGNGFATTGYNRRAVYLRDKGKTSKARTGITVNGHVVMYGQTNDPDFASYEAGQDPSVNLLYTFDAAGKLTGAVINVPCPSQTGESDWMIHGSFWNNVREKLTARYGSIGVIAQSGAAGDLSPRCLHNHRAELRRYLLKYRDKIDAYIKNPMKPDPASGSGKGRVVGANSREIMEVMRAEDTAERIVHAFDEVLSWAGKEKYASPVIRHEVRTLQLPRRKISKALVEAEKRNHAACMKEKFMTKGDPWKMLQHNSHLSSRRSRMNRVIRRYELQKKEPFLKTNIHAVRIGDIAFASNRFELYMDFMHRIQARSPFDQTFIVQLTVDRFGSGSYLPTARAERNRGYGATAYSTRVTSGGGQVLVNETVKSLKNLYRENVKKNPAVVRVPKVKRVPGKEDWKKAVLLKNFCSSDQNIYLKAPTKVRLLHDGKFLYVKMHCGLSEDAKSFISLAPSAPKRDADVWRVENVEFFISSGKEYYQFILGPDDCMQDFASLGDPRKTSSAWNCRKVRWSAVRNGPGWEGFLAIPLDEIKFASKGKKGVYRFNVYRTAHYKTAGGLHKSDLGCYLASFGRNNNMSRFGTLILAE